MTTPPARPAAPKRGLSPAQFIVLSFLGAILAGGLLLALPIAHAPGQQVGLLDAIFTAASAVCITGLTVVDTGSAYSRFGQAVILLLFQAGGLGILTLGMLLALITRRRVGFSARMQIRAQLNVLQIGGILKLVQRIFLLVLAVELLGALLLYLRFGSLEGPLEGVFYAVFYSVSAFNNAGFGLYPDSLMRFVGDPLVCLSVALLILLGGLGFTVILNLLAKWRGDRPTPLSLHTKLVLLSSAVLLGFGAVMVLVLEWANPATLAELPLSAKLLASFFQSVTPRSAGFHTLDYGQMTETSVLITILLMFIGANPGSTGGGIKTVTFAVLLGSIWAIIRGKGELNVFGRHIRTFTIVRAGVIVFSAALAVGAALILLSMSDPDLGFLPLFFESVSAFSTTGLSLGVTASLSSLGKWVIMALMFLGRVGLPTFALALVEEEPDRRVRYPDEEVVIG